MSLPTHEELRWRFGETGDPEIDAREQRILEVLLEAHPRTKQRLIDEAIAQAIEQGRVIEARVVLRQVLALRQLAPSQGEDARIEACADLATLERWYDQAVTAASVAAALE